MNSVSWFGAGTIASFFAAYCFYRAFAVQGDESKKQTDDAVSAIVTSQAEAENRLREYQSKNTEEIMREQQVGNEQVIGKLDDLRQFLEQRNKNYEDELRKEFPYGYVLFAGAGRNGQWIPVVPSNRAIVGDWLNTSLNVSRSTKQYEISLPLVALVVDGAIAVQAGGVSISGNYELNQDIGPRMFTSPGKPYAAFRILDDSAEPPIWVIGFRLFEE